MFLILLLSALFHVEPTQRITTTAPVESVRELVCPLSDKLGSMGTATVVGKNMVLTDYHVIYGRKSPCVFKGNEAVAVLYQNADEDIAILAVDTGDIAPVRVSCDGLIAGKTYLAVGFPGFLNNGFDSKLVMHGTFPNITFETEITEKPPVIAAAWLITSDVHWNGIPTKEYPFGSHALTVMSGGVYEGMSGGPLFNDKDEIAGLVTSILMLKDGNFSANRDLKGTGLCR